jgi:hypothetical protein
LYGQAVDTRSPERNKQGRNNPTLPVILNANKMLMLKIILYKVSLIQILVLSLHHFQRKVIIEGIKNIFKHLYIMKYKYEYYKLLIVNQRQEIIEEIKTQMIQNNAQEINLHRGIIVSSIDYQTNKVIGRFTLDQRAFIDDGFYIDSVSFQDLTTEQLVGILQMIEEKQFDVEETIEEN